MAGKSGIKIKKSHEGRLRRATHTAKGDKIPLAKEEKELHSKDPAKRREAQFAINERGWNHKGKKKGK